MDQPEGIMSSFARTARGRRELDQLFQFNVLLPKYFERWRSDTRPTIVSRRPRLESWVRGLKSNLPERIILLLAGSKTIDLVEIRNVSKDNWQRLYTDRNFNLYHQYGKHDRTPVLRGIRPYAISHDRFVQYGLLENALYTVRCA